MEPTSDRLTIFHYHLSRGGVTEVIASSVETVFSRIPHIGSVTIVCGDPDNTEALHSRLSAAAARHGKQFAIDVVPEIGYLDMRREPDPGLAGAVRSVLAGYRGSTWWVHNYQLGKNPVFTNVLVEILTGEPDQTAVLHVHDFPECSRYENLAFLNAHLTRPPYPVRPNVRYAVINARDREMLVNAGIPESNVALLNNPVKPARLDRSGSAAARRALGSAFGGEFPRFRPDRPLILYPVRTIRRKNVLELGLIALLDPAEPNLTVTLPGVSELERPYSDIVERGFREGLIPGLWGIGNRLEDAGTDFPSLLAAADMVGSSSVQEGFGYLYVDAGQMGVPLIARRLDILDGIADVFDPERCCFYDSLNVPVDRRAINSLTAAYRDRLKGLLGFLSDAAVSRLEGELGSMFEGGFADFSFLGAESQYEILRRVHDDEGLGNEIRTLNPEIFGSLSRLHRQPLKDGTGTLDPRFTADGVARGIEGILSSFGGGAAPDPEAESRIQGRLIEAFARKEYIRLLYD